MINAPTEFEVKFFPINLGDMREKLIKVDAKIKTPERLMRRCVFAAFANPGMNCTYIRVRDEGNNVTLSAKQHATDGKISLSSAGLPERKHTTVPTLANIVFTIRTSSCCEIGTEALRKAKNSEVVDALVKVNFKGNELEIIAYGLI